MKCISSLTEIEEQTGLIFASHLYDANPLLFLEPEPNNAENIVTTPERIEVAQPKDIVNTGDRRESVRDDDFDIHIAAALVNPEGTDRGNEWVSVINLGNDEIDISGWYLSDNSGIKEPLAQGKRHLLPGESIVARQLSKIRLSNRGDVIKLYTANDERVDWVQYNKGRVKPGEAVKFLRTEDGML
ncbi:lamin tail domain-containing protein [Veronia nyctiphanis]|uniref:lamin tail domain-containing protein n=1 Tax=Veronia nyctiphanis TaxID=1278244 RepID=UPI00191C1F22|nr:lamin tail domain-containing protein [Veronia nyctiphanis]